MKINPIFNPQGDDSKGVRKIWEGNPTNLCQLNDVKYTWARLLYKQMRNNFWIPQKLDVSSDKNDYPNLTESERNAYNMILGFLVFLDSIQVANISNVKSTVTASEVTACLVEQVSQEQMHSESYQYLIETILPEEDRAKIYELWRTDNILRERCNYIAGQYQQYQDDSNTDNYLYALVSDYILEGLYFYNGFVFFYNLVSRHLMPGTADIIKLIHRDEVTHTRLYQELILEAKRQYPDSEVWEDVPWMFDNAVENEINWTTHVTQNQILGITPISTEQYTNYLASTRLKAIGYKVSENVVNPYKHLDRFSDVSSEATTKANFFETGVTSYQMSSVVSKWDF